MNNGTGSNTKKERQDAVSVQHRDLSTDELNVRVQHTNTLIALYQAQRARNQRTITDASSDVRACDKMIADLTSDVSTLTALIRTRRSS